MGEGPLVSDRRYAALAERYLARTRRSRALAARHRPVLTDVRAANRFAPAWKELVYPIVCPRSDGARLWDVDGNEYVDLTMGFGVDLLGHRPPAVAAAIAERLAAGMHLGAEHELTGEVAALVAEMTGHERVAFVSTGSEAVHTALRLARTATGRTRVAVFRDHYHGWYDGVLGEAGPDGASVPVAPGIPPAAVGDLLVLEYDDEASLDALGAAAPQLAAILCEPIPARRPELRAGRFLGALRELASAAGAALVFDEMVTGFRLGPGGAQELLGVRADLAAYGKVLGGGLPIGAVAGDARWLDGIDGGVWRYGDGSLPTAPQTFFAGTFSRHPLAMAAALAVLRHLREAGPGLHRDLAARTDVLAERMRASIARRAAPLAVGTCGSMLRVQGDDDLRELLTYHLVDRGVFVCETRTWFLSTAHGDGEVGLVADAFDDALAEMAGAW